MQNSIQNTFNLIQNDIKTQVLVGSALSYAGYTFIKKKYFNNDSEKGYNKSESKKDNKSESKKDNKSESKKDNKSVVERDVVPKYDLIYIKNSIESSINCNDIQKLKHSIELLEGLISGYKILNEKCLNQDYHVDYYLYKLIKYRIKSYYNLANLYVGIHELGKANYNYIKSLDSTDTNDASHHKYIHNIFHKLKITGFIC